MMMTIVVAAGVFHVPLALIADAMLLGVLFGLLRIGWIIVPSIFPYKALRSRPVSLR